MKKKKLKRRRRNGEEKRSGAVPSRSEAGGERSIGDFPATSRHGAAGSVRGGRGEGRGEGRGPRGTHLKKSSLQ